MKRTLAFLGAGILGAGLLAAVAHWSGIDWQGKPVLINQPPPVPHQISVQAKEEKRKVYPYSIVPGGAITVVEARRAMRDPAVCDHYAQFDLKKLKQVVLTADLSGYVSYKLGDKIYWTAKQVRLKAGETVFTDGQNIVRGRCLNCYSAHPMLPIRPREPTEAVMDTSVEVPALALGFPSLPLETVPTLPPPPSPTTTTSALPHAHRGKFIPIIPIIPPIIHHRHTPPPSPPPTITVVPEPSYGWVIAPGLALLIIFDRVRRKRAKQLGG